MVSSEPFCSLFYSDETGSSSRISFSSEFLDESNFITICPNPQAEREEREAKERGRERGAHNNIEFEFLSENLNNSNSSSMTAADELFLEGKMLPFRDAEKLKRIDLKSEAMKKEESSMTTWFVDEDPSPSPKPPKCTTVLWKELLKLKKLQRSSTLSNSSSSSSRSASSSSSSSSSTRIENIRGEEERKGGVREREKCSKRTKKGEGSIIRIRPVLLNVPPICTHANNNAAALPPLFSLRRGRLHR